MLKRKPSQVATAIVGDKIQVSGAWWDLILPDLQPADLDYLRKSRVTLEIDPLLFQVENSSEARRILGIQGPRLIR